MATPEDKQLFIAFGDKKSIASQYNYMEDDLVAYHSKASVGRTFEDYDGNISVKSDFNRLDYERFRSKTTNLDSEKIFDLCQRAYQKVGIVRNTIDIMSDLGCQGITIQHPVRKTERFLQAWFAYVNGPSVSERFLNMLYRLCNVPIKSAYGEISFRAEQEFSKTRADIDNTEFQEIEIVKRSIPLKYTFIHPNSIEVVGGNTSLLLTKPYYAMKIPQSLRQEISKLTRMGKSGELQKLYTKLTKEVQNLITSANSVYIPLDQDKFDIYYYKKDDWQVWATPIIYSILDDLVMLERMKLADASALDGAISNIRHWQIGIIDTANLNNSIFPTKNAINKMKTILTNNVGGGTMDLVTGPEVTFKESSTQVHQFLGSEKYQVTLDSIYDGLGIPPPLRSSGKSGGGNATNNYVSLKTLIERLNYGRSILTQFWEKQLKIVQKAMGHAHPGQVTYDQIILSDEGAQKKLLIELVDRDIISPDEVVKYFGFIPEIVSKRVNRTHKKRVDKKMPPKAGPYHNAMAEHELEKTFAQQGAVTPSQVGLELPEPKANEETILDKKIKAGMGKSKNKAFQSKQQRGRPTNVTETTKRKKKPNFRPQTGASYVDLMLWTEKTYDNIAQKLSSDLLSELSKKSLRQLTQAQANELEVKKFTVLCNTVAMSEKFNENYDETPEYVAISSKYDEFLNDYINKHNKQPTLEESRKMQILAYVDINLTNF